MELTEACRCDDIVCIAGELLSRWETLDFDLTIRTSAAREAAPPWIEDLVTDLED